MRNVQRRLGFLKWFEEFKALSRLLRSPCPFSSGFLKHQGATNTCDAGASLSPVGTKGAVRVNCWTTSGTSSAKAVEMEISSDKKQTKDDMNDESQLVWSLPDTHLYPPMSHNLTLEQCIFNMRELQHSKRGSSKTIVYKASRILFKFSIRCNLQHNLHKILTVVGEFLLLPGMSGLFPECHPTAVLLGLRATDLEAISTECISGRAIRPDGTQHPCAGGIHPEKRCQS